jgi:broad specificity phosphatase PhoE
MPRLVLIKHSLPDVRSIERSSVWPLSDEGRRRCGPLAERLRSLGLSIVVASREPKAAETGRLLAEALGLPFETREGLHEHERDREPFGTTEEFEARVRELFRRPAERVYGEESADEALARFSTAVEGCLAEAPHHDLAVVAHGTVISLFVAVRSGLDGFDLWGRLGLPSFVVLETSGWAVLEIVDRVEA